MWSTQGLNVLAEAHRAFVPAMLILMYLSTPDTDT
jgi:predicted small integral membrane protein